MPFAKPFQLFIHGESGKCLEWAFTKPYAPAIDVRRCPSQPTKHFLAKLVSSYCRRVSMDTLWAAWKHPLISAASACSSCCRKLCQEESNSSSKLPRPKIGWLLGKEPTSIARSNQCWSRIMSNANKHKYKRQFESTREQTMRHRTRLWLRGTYATTWG